jgi:hypothetical protein
VAGRSRRWDVPRHPWAAAKHLALPLQTETLQSIASALWGDQNLWYLIGDANGLTLQDPLPVGQTLRIPERATVVHNTADTFKPYDAAAAIGDTTPLPVPGKAGGGCGVVGQVISVAIAVAVTVALSGAGTAALSSTMSSLFTGELAADIATGAVAAAAGSTASQAFNIATGMQSGFNWSAVATAAVSGGVTAGVSDALTGFKSLSSLNGWQGAAVRATISNTVAQGVGIVTGLQSGFDWRSVAVAGISAAVSQRVAGDAKGARTFAQSFQSSMAGATAAAIASGGRISLTQIAVDGFGNALGSSLLDMAATRASGTPMAGNINISALRAQAEQDDFNRAYPQASLTANAYAQRDQFEASGLIPSNELPQMSVPGAPLGAFMNDGGSSNGLNYDPSKPYVIVYGQKLSKDQWAEIDRYEAGQTAAEFGAGVWDGAKSLPDAAWNGIKTVGDGYRGLAYLLSGNIDSFQPRSNVTLDSIGRGIYHSSPLDIVGSLMEGRYRQAGSDTFGTAIGFAATKFTPELSKAPGLNYDVGAATGRTLYSFGDYAANRLDNWLDSSRLRTYAVPPGPSFGANISDELALHARAAEKGYPGVQVTSNGGPTFANTDYLFPVQAGQQNVLNLEMTGSRRLDFKAANEAVGLQSLVPSGADSPSGYVWHHVDNFNPLTGTATLELVERGAHNATIPHRGSVYQWEQLNGIPYKR